MWWWNTRKGVLRLGTDGRANGRLGCLCETLSMPQTKLKPNQWKSSSCWFDSYTRASSGGWLQWTLESVALDSSRSWHRGTKQDTTPRWAQRGSGPGHRSPERCAHAECPLARQRAPGRLHIDTLLSASPHFKTFIMLSSQIRNLLASLDKRQQHDFHSNHRLCCRLRTCPQRCPTIRTEVSLNAGPVRKVH